MDVRNCKGCSRLFNYLGGQQLCPDCIKALDVKFDEVREYVYDHPGAGMQQVAEEMDVSVAQIKRWIREERLSFSEESQVGLECEGCGKMIRTGRFCLHNDVITLDLTRIKRVQRLPQFMQNEIGHIHHVVNGA